MFRQLILARIIEPTSKQDSLRVLEEVGVQASSSAPPAATAPSRSAPGNRSSPPQTHSHTTYATHSAGYTYAAGASPEGHRSGLSKARREEQLKTDDTGHADYV
ncbi:MAG: hypothetical protein ACRDP9_24985, partial [Kribbellaceae bacterium]